MKREERKAQVIRKPIKEIDLDEIEISTVNIVDSKGVVRFTMGGSTVLMQALKQKKRTLPNMKNFVSSKDSNVPARNHKHIATNSPLRC